MCGGVVPDQGRDHQARGEFPPHIGQRCHHPPHIRLGVHEGYRIQAGGKPRDGAEALFGTAGRVGADHKCDQDGGGGGGGNNNHCGNGAEGEHHRGGLSDRHGEGDWVAPNFIHSKYS